ncbi:MAG TPA: hypothetical protein PKO36_07935 [Candidatus Hydrogenedentes bacterium]|nr:hypothetical protein [Candidatus Hydrogenedentota bacterium]HPC17162.1 hypothetical protein [Candidatus Hydrogenedentota bacterium]HRT21063.1 hypothetical protein [Candidatus Hydrogenedentota bacterium]HRT65892.1 hypothetical protein [Candidatus Hydrogenedentota bacterium]
MNDRMVRRKFLKGALAAGMASGAGPEERAFLMQLSQTDAQRPAQPSRESCPTGAIGNLSISRVICGGNLIGGWAHSRDLIYVSRLFKAYNTDAKIMETLQVCEEHGVNAILTNPVSGPVINRYWRERGGKIQWISEVHPMPANVKASVTAVVDNGACMAYIQGAVGDRLIKMGHLDTLAQTVEFIKACGVPAGVGAHSLDVVLECEKAGVNPDFYVKTLHSNDYWSRRRPDQPTEVIEDRHDNFWCHEPEKTIAAMKMVEKPWIAFKVLAAGAIPPEIGFRYAFENGADFICVGMFDFQVAEDVAVARRILAETRRERPWRA